MRSNYQKEVDQLHLSNDIRQQILAGEKKQHKKQPLFPVLRYVLPICLLVIAIGAGWLVSLPSSPKPNSYGLAVHKDISTIKLPKTGSFEGIRPQLPEDSYQPQHIDYMGGGGTSSEEKKKVDEIVTQDIQEPSNLRVYERTYGIGYGLPAIDDKEAIKRETAIKKTLAKLPKKQEVSLSFWNVSADGTVMLEAHIAKQEKLSLQEAAQCIRKAYPELFPSKSSQLTQHIVSLNYQEEIAIVQKDSEIPALEQALLHGIWIEDNDTSYLLRLPQAQDYKEVQSFPILNPKEALQVMKQGGYYTTQPIANIHNVTIQSMELVYGCLLYTSRCV